MSLRLVFIGTPDFAVAPLERLCQQGLQVVAVYTQPDRPAGRGKHPVSPRVKIAARELGLPVLQPASFKDAAVVARLVAYRPELIVVAAFGQLLPPAVLEIPKYGCLNLHPSLLPRFRGASPVAAAILAGDEFTGVSVMRLDAGLDTGPVLAQAQIPVSAGDTTGTLSEKLSRIAAGLLQDVLVRHVRGEIAPQPQDDTRATYCGEITKADGRIDWHLPAEAIWRRVRAFQPWPGCYTGWVGKQLRIMEAVPLAGEISPGVGQVVALGEAFGVGCGEGVLGVCRVQLAGKRATTAAEFIRGQREFIGATLGEGGY